MQLIIDILNKGLIILLFLAILNVIRHTYFFIGAYFKAGSDDPQRYLPDGNQVTMLGLSIAYILTIIFTGVQI